MLMLFLSDPNLLWVLGSVVLLGLCAGAVGTVLNLRKQGLLGDVLAHAALPGVAFSYILFSSRSSLVLMAGALVSCTLAYLLIKYLLQTTKIKTDSAFAITLSFFFALGASLITYIQRLPSGSQAGLDRLLFGQAGALTAADLRALVFLALVTLFFFLLFSRKLKHITFDSEYCQVQGVHIRYYELILAALSISLIALSLQLVGAVMLAGILIIPAAATRLWIATFYQMLVASSLLAALSGVLGVLVSYSFPAQPTGPWIVLWASVIFVFSLILAPKQGLLFSYLRRRKLQERIDTENILRSLYREYETLNLNPVTTGITTDALMLHRDYSRQRLQSLLGVLSRQNFVVDRNGEVALTAEGLKYATMLTKGHRLWEAWLATEGAGDPAYWHHEAEEVEHFLSSDQVNILEERLQQPQSDPHGRKIPGGRE
jgi:manganese/zinc/iron transport system permease protein